MLIRFGDTTMDATASRVGSSVSLEQDKFASTSEPNSQARAALGNRRGARTAGVMVRVG
jgi:hypothetical protein